MSPRADATHVEFTFTNPIYQEWDNNLYNIPIVPKHLWASKTADDIATGANANPVGSGAYLYLATGQDRNVWQRNDNWWGISSVWYSPHPSISSTFVPPATTLPSAWCLRANSI